MCTELKYVRTYSTGNVTAVAGGRYCTGTENHVAAEFYRCNEDVPKNGRRPDVTLAGHRAEAVKCKCSHFIPIFHSVSCEIAIRGIVRINWRS